MQRLISETLPGIFSSTFTIIIPAYNEEDVIGKTLDEICDFISSNHLKWSVIVSVEGRDGTSQIVSHYQSIFPFISEIKSNVRNGKGGAIKRALDRIESDYTILMDADGSMPFRAITYNLLLLGEYDALIFSRYFRDNSIPFVRKLLSRVFNILVQASLGLRIRDTQSGYKAFRSDLFISAIRKVGSTNTFLDVALLFYLKKEGARVKEVKSIYEHRERGKFNPISGIIGMGASLVAFRIRHSRFYKYVPDGLIDLYYRKFRWI